MRGCQPSSAGRQHGLPALDDSPWVNLFHVGEWADSRFASIQVKRLRERKDGTVADKGKRTSAGCGNAVTSATDHLRQVNESFGNQTLTAGGKGVGNAPFAKTTASEHIPNSLINIDLRQRTGGHGNSQRRESFFSDGE